MLAAKQSGPSFAKSVDRDLTPAEIKSLAEFAKENGGKDLRGFSVHKLPTGQAGMITADNSLTAKGAWRIVALLNKWKENQDFEIEVENSPATTITRNQNWKEDPNGKGYLSTLEPRGGSGRVRQLDRYRRGAYRDILREELKSAGAKGSFSLKRGIRRRDSGYSGSAKTKRWDPLPGAPIKEGATGPDPRLNEVAESYAKSIGIQLRRQAEYVRVDPDRASRIADAYEAMPHDPSDPAVQEAYQNLIDQTMAQYRALESAGYEFYFAAPETATANPWDDMRELRKHKQMSGFPTEEGHASG